MRTNTKMTRRLALAGIAAAGVSAVGARAFPRLWYRAASPLERCEIDTRHKLAEYERTGNAAPLRAWLLSGDGGYFKASSFVLKDWAIRHPARFVDFLETFDTKQETQYIDAFAYELADSGSEREFLSAFQGYRSPKLSPLLAKLQQWQNG